MTEIKFDKYQKRGSNYHWHQIKSNIFNISIFVQARYKQVLGQIPNSQELKILDIGCGDGVLLSLVHQKTKAQLFGIDLDDKSLKIAKTKVKAKFIKSSAYQLPFNNDFFDIVIAGEVIEHLKKPEKMIAEIKRVLKPSAKAIITTPVKLADKPEDKMHVQEFTPLELNQILGKYFNKVTIKTSHPLLFRRLYLYRLVKIGRFHLEPFRWLLNLWTIITKLNPFKLSFGQPTNQIAIVVK